jgi:hypothetical protein
VALLIAEPQQSTVEEIVEEKPEESPRGDQLEERTPKLRCSRTS